MALGSISLLSSSAITAFVNTTQDRAAAQIGISVESSFFLQGFRYLILLSIGMLIAILVLASIFKWTPHCKVFWKEAFSGALVSTILWEVGSFIFYKVVQLFDYARVYGSMGVIIALLAWVYTSNLILLFGANFSAQFHWVAMDMPDSDIPPPK
jgi:membrane protein